jgi:hypothetical protein
VAVVTDITEAVRDVCNEAQEKVAGSPLADLVVAATARLDAPLRVAIAGRVKAGKSTLLNALVGERLAPTDARECTLVVTDYRRGASYDVVANLVSGEQRTLPFGRGARAIDIDLQGLSPADIERLEVRWPSSALASVTLVDTPGLESAVDENSARTRDLLMPEDGAPHVDAVIYLMRHVHRADASFLDAFCDRSVSDASPANAVAVLSRADEIGAARLNAMDSAQVIAERLRADPRLRRLVATVVPIAGLAAEAGLTLQEDEYAALSSLAGLSATDLDLLCLSVDHFLEPSRSDLTIERRRDLLDRLGMFGVRWSIARIRRGDAPNASALSRALVEVSGLGALQSLLREHFLPRAEVLKARSVLGALRVIAGQLPDETARRMLTASIERAESSTHELAELRLLHLMVSGTVELDDADRSEVERITSPGTPTQRLGVESMPDGVAVALEGVERWRSRAADPLADPAMVDACEVIARSYEGLYVAVSRADS